MTQEAELRKALEQLASLFARGEIAPDAYAQQHRKLLAQLTQTLANPSLQSMDETYEGWHLPSNTPIETPTSDNWLTPLSTDADVSKMLTPLPHMGTEVLSIPEDLTPISRAPLAPSSQSSWNPPNKRWTPPIHKGDIIRDRYRIEEQLSQGSMGPLFRVKDTRFGGTYAIRILHPKIANDEASMERWLSILHNHHTLNHPGLARTYLVDDDSRQNIVFYLREDVPGRTLESYLNEAQAQERIPFSLERTLELFEALVSTVQYAHQRKHFHLDLVPSNIILTEGLEDTIPIKLLDFLFQSDENVLASRSASSDSKHQDLFYRAPEQLLQASEPDAAGHCFALGVLLYQMLTGSLPIAMASTPSESNKDIPAKLDEVLRRAMSPRAQDRHSSVKELSKEVLALFPHKKLDEMHPSSQSWSYLDTSQTPITRKIQQVDSTASLDETEETGTPLTVAPVSSPGASTSAKGATGSGLKPQPSPTSRSPHQNNFPSSPGSFHPKRTQPKAQSSNVPRLPGVSSSRNDSAHPYKPNRTNASAYKAPPLHAPQTPLSSQFSHLSSPLASPRTPLAQGPKREMLQTQETQAISNADRIARLRAGQTPAPKRVSQIQEAQTPLPTLPPSQTLQGHTQGITAIAAQPRGLFLATASLDGTLRLWDTQSWYPLHQIEVTQGSPRTLQWNAAGDLLLYSTSEGDLHLQDLQNSQPVWSQPSSGSCVGAQWHAEQDVFYAAFSNGEIACWQWTGKTAKQRWSVETEEAQALYAMSNHDWLVTCNAQHIEVWEKSNGRRIHQAGLPSHSMDVLCCAPRKPIVLLGGHTGEIMSWNCVDRRFLRHWHSHQQALRALVVPSHGQWFASAANDQRIHLWSWEQDKPLCTFAPQQGAIRTLAVEKQGKWLATGGTASNVCIWDTSIWNTPS